MGVTQQGITSPIEGDQFDMTRFGEESLNWITTYYAELLIAAVLAVGIFFLLSLLRRRLQRLADAQKNKNDLFSLILRVVSRTGAFFLFALSIVLVKEYAHAPEQLSGMIDLIFFIALVFQSAIWIRALVLGLLDHRIIASDHREVELQNARALIRLLVTIALAAIAVVIILDNIGVNVTALVAGLGVGGIAIGLAARDIFADLFAALSIIFDKPFCKGDVIQFDNFIGEVEVTGLKTTRVRSISGEQLIISNTNLLDKEVRNLTRLHKRLVDFSIGVIYQTTPQQAAAIPEIFREIVEEHGHDYVRCGFTGFGDSALNFRMEFEIMSAKWDEVFAGRSAVGLALVKRFAEEGIEFAYPTQVNFTAAADGSMISPIP